ncbi:hypothetical protein [Wenjunlia tyrosinilytica]|jgi:hypothetical protein|uniref:Uncharacterized protein n=1 Tax=Wenjunlia tyrosinilytica TaxID=1544741 RepID=A0A917ZXN1_9ACTN|nr:hypothetical protein [Wenjunlia tyrosinilytica]GGO97815.1 hypothetical protein GCM10012280_60490 [Wenjunlia tyrosinilytica]
MPQPRTAPLSRRGLLTACGSSGGSGSPPSGGSGSRTWSFTDDRQRKAHQVAARDAVPRFSHTGAAPLLEDPAEAARGAGKLG